MQMQLYIEFYVLLTKIKQGDR